MTDKILFEAKVGDWVCVKKGELTPGVAKIDLARLLASIQESMSRKTWDFMKDDYLASRDNLNFFANVVDYLADDAGLISIRSKNISQPPLEQVSDGTKRLLKYTNLVLPPLVIVAYGLFRWRRRVSLKKALEDQSR